MSNPPQMDLSVFRMLLADWFRKLSETAGMNLDEQFGASGQQFTIGAPTGFHVTARFIPDPPYLKFQSSDANREREVREIALQAVSRATANDFGGPNWYSTVLTTSGLQIALRFNLGAFLEQLGNQTRVVGWRRLGPAVLLEFSEELPPDWKEGSSALAPVAKVHMHVQVAAPCVGLFSSRIVHGAVEAVAAICTFALGRCTELPAAVFPSQPEVLAALRERPNDQAIPTLARKGVSLDIFSWVSVPGGRDYFTRLRAALLTFDAAMQQRHDSVACILYVVVAECLATPNTPWNNVKVTKRFVEFYDELMPSALDRLVAHPNLEAVFGIKRGARTARSLRRELLSSIYAFRSGHVHCGLRPSYRGLGLLSGAEDVRRGFFAEFAEEALLGYMSSPRSSFIGHPAFTEPERNGLRR